MFMMSLHDVSRQMHSLIHCWAYAVLGLFSLLCGQTDAQNWPNLIKVQFLSSETCSTLWLTSSWRRIHTAAGSWAQTHLKSFDRTTWRPKETESWLSWTFLHSHMTSTPLNLYGGTWRLRKEGVLWHHKMLCGAQAIIILDLKKRLYYIQNWQLNASALAALGSNLRINADRSGSNLTVFRTMNHCQSTKSSSSCKFCD